MYLPDVDQSKVPGATSERSIDVPRVTKGTGDAREIVEQHRPDPIEPAHQSLLPMLIALIKHHRQLAVLVTVSRDGPHRFPEALTALRIRLPILADTLSHAHILVFGFGKPMRLFKPVEPIHIEDFRLNVTHARQHAFVLLAHDDDWPLSRGRVNVLPDGALDDQISCAPEGEECATHFSLIRTSFIFSLASQRRLRGIVFHFALALRCTLRATDGPTVALATFLSNFAVR